MEPMQETPTNGTHAGTDTVEMEAEAERRSAAGGGMLPPAGSAVPMEEQRAALLHHVNSEYARSKQGVRPDTLDRSSLNFTGTEATSKTPLYMEYKVQVGLCRTCTSRATLFLYYNPQGRLSVAVATSCKLDRSVTVTTSYKIGLYCA